MVKALYYALEKKEKNMGFFAALGRMCFAIIFILAGVNKIMNWGESEQSLTHSMLNMVQYVQTYEPAQRIFDFLLLYPFEVLLVGTLIEFIGGILIFFGIAVRLGALILALFLIPTTILFHSFWWQQGMERDAQIVSFLKNLAIFGAALILLSYSNKTEKKKIKE